MACKSCRSKKIKCDRTRPICQNCRLRSIACTYVGERRTKEWMQSNVDSRRFSTIRTSRKQQLSEGGTRSDRITTFPQSASAMPNQRRVSCTSNLSAARGAREMQQERDVDMLQSQPPWDQIGSDPMTCDFDQIPSGMGVTDSHTPTNSNGEDETLLDRILEGKDMECTKDRNPALWMRSTDGDEYTGPSSGISTISDLGLNWVRHNVPDSQVLCETIQDIRNGVLSHLRQPKCVPQVLPRVVSSPCNLKVKETPNPEVVKYIEEYFDTVQVIFPVLDRAKFFSQLETYGTRQSISENPSWQALLSAVLASGCRAALSAETAEAFKKSGQEAWGYFQNALSFESCITHGSTDLMAVQAIAIMTIFAQGLSSPQRLEYTLSSIAARLAQSVALNRHPPPDWSLSEEEQRDRNRVFWVIYCLDRTISLRCGRPAVISDDDISCCFPRDVLVIQHGNSEPVGVPEVDFFLCATKLARIAGKVSRMLYSVSALYTSSSRLLPVMNSLLKELHAWLSLLPSPIRPGQPPNRMTKTFGLSREQIIVLHLSYYYLLCSIYRRFTPIFTQDSDNLQHLVNSQMHCSHIEAARSMVLLTKHLDVESFTPAWLVFYYPFTALTTIFVHIVCNPPSDTTPTDIALMETVVGFFGRLEYVTSGEAAFTKTAEFVRQARNIHNKYSKDRAQARQCESIQVQGNNLSIGVAGPFQPCINIADDRQIQIGQRFGKNYDAQMSRADNGHISGETPPLTGPLQQEENSDTQSAHPEMEIPQDDLSIYSELLSLLAPPDGDAAQASWLRDWVSAV
ncbi:unnamed protein product [Clonostachys byssicola]|uniref:Zn(2)-C6 fungal-type domain-containing protein n=1 Tax=Clonostachys byssicola TaxID=160290 RepID=A0A9N9UAM5_9HYPO|nr:unnamed protein product [Clonostachys byssicola]